MFVKVCGITRSADAIHAVEHGATALGFVFWTRSPRHISAAAAAAIIRQLPQTITPVGVFVDASVDSITTMIEETGIRAVQLHGNESPSYADALAVPVFRAVTVEDGERECAVWPLQTTFLLDTVDPVRRGGTGLTIDWNRAAVFAQRRKVVLAGGLTPANVAEAIAATRPYGVDVSSGVEDAPGIKDVDKVARFLARARHAFEHYEN